MAGPRGQKGVVACPRVRHWVIKSQSPASGFHPELCDAAFPLSHVVAHRESDMVLRCAEVNCRGRGTSRKIHDIFY